MRLFILPNNRAVSLLRYEGPWRFGRVEFSTCVMFQFGPALLSIDIDRNRAWRCVICSKENRIARTICWHCGEQKRQ